MGPVCRWYSAGSEGRRLWLWQQVLLVNTARKGKYELLVTDEQE